MIGGAIRRIALGGNDYGNLTLTRFYTLHVLLLPAVVGALTWGHAALARKHGPTPLMVGPEDPAYGAFLNWMYFSDATLTFPQTLVLRYTQLEPEERRNPQVATDYAKWFLGRLRAVEAATANAETLCAGRFTAADIVIGYALRLADNIGLAKDFGPNVAAYWARLQQREGFKRAVVAEQKAGVEQNVAPRVRA